MNRQQRGRNSEWLAERFLHNRGLVVKERNYRCRFGEIDLIMETASGTLVFIEVRYRRDRFYGGAAASVDRRKQQKLRRTAADFLQRHQLGNSAVRFDVVGVEGDNTIDWVQSAFGEDSKPW